MSRLSGGGPVPIDEKRITEAVDTVGRCGAKSLTLGYLVDDPPPGVANWYASAEFRAGELTTTPMAGPVEAVEALATMLRVDGTCAWCGRLISWGLRGGPGHCWWRKIGGRWERGCPRRDTPAITVRR